MVCCYCKQSGHNYRRCPTIPEEEKQKKIKENKEKREKQKKTVKEEYINYEIINNSNTELVLYYGFIGGSFLVKWAYIDVGQTKQIKCRKSCHCLAVIPFLEIYNGSPDSPSQINISLNKELLESSMFFEDLCNYNGDIILINKQYIPQKTEMEQWKECALKSKFLLDQIKKITGGDKTHQQYENIIPFIDMIQDITIPDTCSELDKERAGIPSQLTNIT
jgi:hypothetical protein